MNLYNIQVVVPTSSLRCRHYTHPVPVPDVEEAGGGGGQAERIQMEEMGKCQREISLMSPFRPELCLPGALQ